MSGPCKNQGESNAAPGMGGESDIRHQVVAVGKILKINSSVSYFDIQSTRSYHIICHCQYLYSGTPLPTASLPSSAHQGPVMLTAKNLQCMRAILSVAHCHGNLLGSSWHIILTVSNLF